MSSCKFGFPHFIKEETEVHDISVVHATDFWWARCRIPRAHTPQFLGLNTYTEFILKWINDDNISDDNLRKSFTAKCPSLEDRVVPSKLGSNGAMMFSHRTWPSPHHADFWLTTVSLSIWAPLQVPYGTFAYLPLSSSLDPGARRRECYFRIWLCGHLTERSGSNQAICVKALTCTPETWGVAIRPSRF